MTTPFSLYSSLTERVRGKARALDVLMIDGIDTGDGLISTKDFFPLPLIVLGPDLADLTTELNVGLDSFFNHEGEHKKLMVEDSILEFYESLTILHSRIIEFERKYKRERYYPGEYIPGLIKAITTWEKWITAYYKEGVDNIKAKQTRAHHNTVKAKPNRKELESLFQDNSSIRPNMANICNAIESVSYTTRKWSGVAYHIWEKSKHIRENYDYTKFVRAFFNAIGVKPPKSIKQTVDVKISVDTAIIRYWK